MEKFIYKSWAGITVLSASFSDFTYKKHCHGEYALGVTQRGVQQYYLAGSLKSSYPHGVMLFNPEQTHDGRSQDSDGIDYVMLYINPELLLSAVDKTEIVRFSAPIVYNSRLEQSILALADAIGSCADEALCSELLLALAGHCTGVKQDTAYKKDDVLTETAKEMIYYNLGAVLRLDDICRDLAISKFKFIRTFKATTGLSPYQYFLNCKVAHARQLIEQHQDVYAAVAACGFADLTHLNRHFKSIYGTTAFEYLHSLH
jgi:AraC-like DNA-binding protein